MDNCRHLGTVNSTLSAAIFNPAKWACEECGTTESVWACLSCYRVSCGRYNEEHSLTHANKRKHPLAMEINQGFVYCYECDDYILNDTAGGDIRTLRDVLTTISNQGSGTKALRNSSLKSDDLQRIVVKHRRISLLGKVFTAWRDAVASKRRPKELLGLGRRRRMAPPPRPALSRTPSTPVLTRKRSMSVLEPVGAEEESAPLPPGVTGLRNLGNTCYMNSVLQILSNLDEFRERFLACCPLRVDFGAEGPSTSATAYARQDTEECVRRVTEPREDSSSSGSGGGLSGEITALLRVMWSGKLSLVIPHGFLHALWSAVPSFRGYRQQDAQEFLCEVLDKLAGELESADEETGPTKKRRASKDSDDPSTAALRDFVGALFSGELESRVRCGHCGAESRTREAFSDLSLEFPPQYQECRLTSLNLAEAACGLGEMLAHFTGTEELGPVYACAACAPDTSESSERPQRRSQTTPAGIPRREAQKQLQISRLPRLLRLHLKRFRWSGRNQRDKLSLHVHFPQLLDMRPYLGPGTATAGGASYALCGVIMHHGRGFNSGHYTSCVWNSRGRFWMHCNDARLQLCTLQEVLASQAYILFYRQVDPNEALPMRALPTRLRTSQSESELGLQSDEEPRRRSARLRPA